MPPKKKNSSDDLDEEIVPSRNVSERRSLPSRSSRPARAAMKDGSEEDDIINEVTTSPLEKVLRESIRTAKKEAGLKSDDDLPGSYTAPTSAAKPSTSRTNQPTTEPPKRGRGRPAKSTLAPSSAPPKVTTSRLPQSDGPSRRAVNRNVYYGNAYYDEEGTDADTESDDDSSDDGPARRQAQKQKAESPKSHYDFKQMLSSLTAAGPSSAPVPAPPVAVPEKKTRQTSESPKKKEAFKKPARPVERASSEEIVLIERPEKTTPKPKGKLNLELLDQKTRGRPRKNYAQSLVTTLPNRVVSSLKGMLAKRMSTRSVINFSVSKKGAKSPEKERNYPKRQLPQKNYDDTIRRARRKAETDVDESSGFDSDRGSLPNIRISTKKLLKRLSQTSVSDLPASPKQFLRQMKPKLAKTDSGEKKKLGITKKTSDKPAKPAKITATSRSRSAKTDVEELDDHVETRTKKLTKITLKPTPNIVKAAAKVERKHTEGYESEGGVRATRRKSNMSLTAPVMLGRPMRERPQVSYDDVKRRAPRKNKKQENEEEEDSDDNENEEEPVEEGNEKEDDSDEEKNEDEEGSGEDEEESDEQQEEEHIRARRARPSINYDVTIRRRSRKQNNTTESADGTSSVEIIPLKKRRRVEAPEKMEVNDEKPKARGRAKKMEEPQSEESSSESSESEEGIRPRRVLPPVNYKPSPQRIRKPKPLVEESEESESEASEEKITARRTVAKVDYSDVKRRRPRKKPTDSSEEDQQGSEEEEGAEGVEVVEEETIRTRRQRTTTAQKEEVEVSVTRTRRSVVVTSQKPQEKKAAPRKVVQDSESELSEEEPGPSTRQPKQRQTKRDSSPEESSSLPSSYEEEKPKGKKGRKPGPKGQRRPQSSVGQNNYFSASSSEDERFVPKILDEAKQMVKKIYTPIIEENKKSMEDQFKDFQNYLVNLPKKEYKTASGTKPRVMNLLKEEIREGFETGSVSGLPEVVPIHYISTTPNWPKMKNWVHLEHNIRTKDSFRLSHIPYINDDHDSVSFVKELKKAYPEGIHGTTKGWGEHISDYLLYRLLKEAIPSWQKTSHEMGYLYQAIFKLFPNKLTARQLQNIYPSLETRFEPTLKKPEEKNKKDDVGHSIRTLLCIKCRQYHCLLHGMTGEPFRMHRQPKPKKPLFQMPCSEHCYLYMPEVELNPPSSDEDEPFIKQKQGLVVAEKPFHKDNDHLFQKMVQIDRHDPCQIASMMELFEKRTCQEVYVLMKKKKQPDREMSPDDIMIRKQTMKEAQSSFRNFTWNLGQGRVDNSEQHACKHKGPCGRNVKECICGQRDTLCFKYCSCGIDCKMRFPGCRCQPGQCRTKQCQCFYAKWECDPDICKTCNCGPVANTTNRPDVKMPELPAHLKYEGDDDVDWLEQDNMKLDDEPIPVCSNVSLQRGNHKKLKVGKSDIAGFGCFIAEPCEKGEFIAEYTGEVITHDEAERRGMIYDEFKTSYIFALNKEYSVDATRMGNPIRFANHSDKDPNCYSQIIMVNGEHRIGIFAKRKIYPREELLFDYQYNKKWKAKYCPIVRGAGAKDNSISSSPQPGPSRKKK